MGIGLGRRIVCYRCRSAATDAKLRRRRGARSASVADQWVIPTKDEGGATRVEGLEDGDL
jgi:hypothetical protein